MVALVIKTLKRSYGCATEFAVEILGGKWKTVILALLKEQDLRYGELRAALPALSDKVLTERLRELEALGLVERPSPGTLYRLSPRGPVAGADPASALSMGNGERRGLRRRLRRTSGEIARFRPGLTGPAYGLANFSPKKSPLFQEGFTGLSASSRVTS